MRVATLQSIVGHARTHTGERKLKQTHTDTKRSETAQTVT